MADDIQLTAGIDDKGVKQGAQRMDRDVKAFVKGAEAEFKRLDSATKRASAVMSSNFKNVARFSQKSGQIAQVGGSFAGELANAGGGAKALAMAGASLLPIFGPAGALVGGVVALGVALYDAAKGTAQIEFNAERANRQFKTMAAATIALGKQTDRDRDEAKILNEERKRGKEAADLLRDQLELQRELNEIRHSGAVQAEKDNASQAAEAKFDAKRELTQSKADKERRAATRREAAQTTLDRAQQILTPAAERSAQRRQQKREDRAIRRAATEEVNALQRERNQESGITSRVKQMSAKERKDEINKRIIDAKLQQKGMLTAELSDDAVAKLTDSIEKLLAK